MGPGLKIFIPKLVAELGAFYGKELLVGSNFSTVAEQLDAIAAKLFEGLKDNLPCLLNEISNYHAEYLGVSHDLLSQRSWTKKDCRHCIALEYGFDDWTDLKGRCAVPRNHVFEDCVNNLLRGDLDLLKRALEMDETLLSTKSQFGHGATLLHYVASNGVEMWRQMIPENIVELTKLLLDAGADKHATMSVYGGAFTTLQLVTSSAHPKEANVHEELVLVLQ